MERKNMIKEDDLNIVSLSMKRDSCYAQIMAHKGKQFKSKFMNILELLLITNQEGVSKCGLHICI